MSLGIPSLLKRTSLGGNKIRRAMGQFKSPSLGIRSIKPSPLKSKKRK